METVNEILASEAKALPQTFAPFGVGEETFQILDSEGSEMVVAVAMINGEKFAAAVIPSIVSVSEDGLFGIDGPVNEGVLHADEEVIDIVRSMDLPDGVHPVPSVDTDEGHYWDKVLVAGGAITLVGFNVISTATPWMVIHDKLDNGGGEFEEYMKKADDVLEAKGFARHFGH